MTFGTTNDRSVSETMMQAGILTRIQYPTGGSTTFSYEAHRVTSSSSIIGGLRVNQIVNDDANGNTSTKSIQYGLGKLYNSTLNYFQYPDNNPNKGGSMIFGIYVSSSPVQAMWSTQGYHIGYYDITETQTGNGKTVYNYFNSSPIGIPNAWVFPLTELVAGYGNSDLSEKDVYHASGIQLSKSLNGKSAINISPTTIRARKVVKVNCIPPSPCNGCACSGGGYFMENYLFTDYYVFSDRYRLNSNQSTQDGVTTATTFEYALNQNTPSAKVVLDSRGVTQRTEWSFPATPGESAPAEMFVVTNPNFKNMIGVPLEQRTYANGSLTSKIRNNYTATNGNVLLTQTLEYPTGGTDFRQSDYLYDATLKLGEVKKNDGTKSAYVWGYNNALIIAEVANSDFQYSTPTTSYFGDMITTNV